MNDLNKLSNAELRALINNWMDRMADVRSASVLRLMHSRIREIENIIAARKSR